MLQTKVLQAETDIKCRLCKQFDETVEHMSSSCSVLATGQYVKRHGIVCDQLQVYTIVGKLDNDHWYGHVPKLVETSPECKAPGKGTSSGYI
jgi:hypothetical protein